MPGLLIISVGCGLTDPVDIDLCPVLNPRHLTAESLRLAFELAMEEWHARRRMSWAARLTTAATVIGGSWIFIWLKQAGG